MKEYFSIVEEDDYTDEIRARPATVHRSSRSKITDSLSDTAFNSVEPVCEVQHGAYRPTPP